MLEEDDSLFAATCAGAHGYILEGADTVEVLRTVRAGRRRGPVRARHRSPAHQVLPAHTGQGHDGQSVSNPHRPRTRGARSHRRGIGQPADRLAPVDLRQDGQQPHLQRLRQSCISPTGHRRSWPPAGPAWAAASASLDWLTPGSRFAFGVHAWHAASMRPRNPAPTAMTFIAVFHRRLPGGQDVGARRLVHTWHRTRGTAPTRLAAVDGGHEVDPVAVDRDADRFDTPSPVRRNVVSSAVVADDPAGLVRRPGVRAAPPGGPRVVCRRRPARPHRDLIRHLVPELRYGPLVFVL